MMNLKVNRKYKERLFLRVFRDRKDLLSLYNAVNGTSYTDSGAVIFFQTVSEIY